MYSTDGLPKKLGDRQYFDLVVPAVFRHGDAVGDHDLLEFGLENAGDRRTGEDRIEVETEVRTEERTGVEMEAFTAAAVALLTIYDMCKSVDRSMVISQVRLVEKRGGKSGTYLREGGT